NVHFGVPDEPGTGVGEVGRARGAGVMADVEVAATQPRCDRYGHARVTVAIDVVAIPDDLGAALEGGAVCGQAHALARQAMDTHRELDAGRGLERDAARLLREHETLPLRRQAGEHVGVAPSADGAVERDRAGSMGDEVPCPKRGACGGSGALRRCTTEQRRRDEQERQVHGTRRGVLARGLSNRAASTPPMNPNMCASQEIPGAPGNTPQIMPPNATRQTSDRSIEPMRRSNQPAAIKVPSQPKMRPLAPMWSEWGAPTAQMPRPET